VPLPGLSISGVGIDLAEVAAGAAVVAVDAGAAVLTVDAAQVRLGALPVARMSATGLTVAGDYPGPAVELGKLAAALAGPPTGHPTLLLAPRALPAARLAVIVAAAGGHELRLAVAAPNPGGWSLPTALPVALAAATSPDNGVHLALGGAGDAARDAANVDLSRGIPVIVADPTATTEQLAAVLAALAARSASAASLVTGKP